MSSPSPPPNLMSSALLKYLPHVVVDHYASRYKESVENGSTEEVFKPKFPDDQESYCVSMFIDVASFTILTAELATFPDGSGQLALALNNLMTGIVGKINKINGDIVKFAGDAILIMWPVTHMDELPQIVNRAVATALNLAQQPEFNQFKVLDPDEKNYFDNQIQVEEDSHPLANQQKTLEIKVGVTFGKAKILYLGGVPDNIVKSRCEYLPVGPGLNEAFIAEGKCNPSEVVVPKKVRDLDIIQKYFLMFPVLKKTKQKVEASPKFSMFGRPKVSVLGGTTRKNSKLKLNLGGKPKKPSHVKKSEILIGLDDTVSSHYVVEGFREANNPLRVPKAYTSFNHIGKALWSYVPVAIVPYFSGISLEFWLPEMRTVTTLFCTLNVSHLNLKRLYEDECLFSSNETAVKEYLEIKDKLQEVFCAIQETVFKYQGTVNKFLVDDKGCSVLIAFGLPPFAHVSDPDRCALCSFGIMGALGRIQVGAHIGITTGVVYCGAIGGNSGVSAQRIEYTIIGDPINVAARLMVEAKKRKCAIIMDENTKILLREKVTTVYLENVVLKGKGKYDCYEVVTAKEDKYVADQDFRRSRRMFTSSIFTSQIKLGMQAHEIVSAFTGENLNGKLSKLNIDNEFTSGNFSKRLETETITTKYTSVAIEYMQEGVSNLINIEIDDTSLKLDNHLQEVKFLALKKLYKLHWQKLEPFPYIKRSGSITPESLKVKKVKRTWQRDPYDEHIQKISTKFALLWKFEHEERPGYLEMNDACALGRFQTNDKVLLFRIARSNSSSWKAVSSSFRGFRRGRRETILKENCFSVVDRLHVFANDFYSPKQHNGRSQNKQKTILLEASNGTGKSFAVSNLINTILKTTNYEVLISGGDPFEDGQNTEPFIIISTILKQLLDLRGNKNNINNVKVFGKDFVENVLAEHEKIQQSSNLSIENVGLSKKIIEAALNNAKEMFEDCLIPPEAQVEEKKNHYFDDSKLYLLNDILGTNFSVGPKHSTATFNSQVYDGSVAASKALSAIITQDNFALGGGFKSKQVDRMSVKINKHMSKRMSALRHMAHAKKNKRHMTRQAFNAQLDEFDTGNTRKEMLRAEEGNTKLTLNASIADFRDAGVSKERAAEEAAQQDAIAERFLNFTSGLFEEEATQLENEKSMEEINIEEELNVNKQDEVNYINETKTKVKLFAAIFAGLAAEGVPLLINIDNAHRADPFSLLVVQELTQWWSSANILLLVSVRKSFSADVGLTNIGNYVVEAKKRMSVVTMDFNKLDAAISDIVVQIENSPNERFNDSQTNTSVLIQQLKDLLKTTRIDLIRDPKFTAQIIEVVLKERDMLDSAYFASELRIDNNIIQYLKQRASGHFLYIQEAIQLYFKHELIEIDSKTPGLVLTEKGRRLFDKALKPNLQNISMRVGGGTARSRSKLRREKRTRNRGRSSVLTMKNSEGKLEDPIFVTPTRNLSRLIPGSLNSAFSEYFDSLRIKEQLLLKCAALVARSNKTISKGQFTFHRVKQVCPFFQDFDKKNSNTEAEVKEAFQILETTQLISKVEKKFGDANSENAMFTFRSDWYVDILISRLLPIQLDRIQRRIEDFRREAENEFFLKVPERERRFKGYLTIKKAGKHGFRKRYCIVDKGVMSMYKEDPKKKTDKDNLRTTIFLHTEAAQVAYYDGPPFKSSFFGSTHEANRAFIIKTNKHIEMSKPSHEISSLNQWLCVAKSDKEAQLWISKTRLQIRISKNQTVKLQMD